MATTIQSNSDPVVTEENEEVFDMKEYGRCVAWDMFACSALGMNYHPGTTRDKAVRMSFEEIAEIADKMLAERDKRFK